MKKHIKIVLDTDTAEFLTMGRSADVSDAISAFINSLLRRERFRQGYVATQASYPSDHPYRNPIEKYMLLYSGLLPLNPRHR